MRLFIIEYTGIDGRLRFHDWTKKPNALFARYADALTEFQANKHGSPDDVEVKSRHVITCYKLDHTKIRLSSGRIITHEGKTFIG